MTDGSNSDEGVQRLLALGRRVEATDASTQAAMAIWMQRRNWLASDCSPAEAFHAIADLFAIVRSFAEPLLHRAFNGEDSGAVQYLQSLKPSDDEVTRSERLRLLALKLKLAGHLLDSGTAAMPFSAVIDELAAINAGDEPRLFARIATKRSRGLGTNAYRLARSQLQALAWDAVLAARGRSAFDRHSILQQAFGVQWDAMRKWLRPCENRLGPASVASCIDEARTSAAAGQPVFGEVLGLSPVEAIQYAGQIYQEELRRRKT